jgi:hypothetical protein
MSVPDPSALPSGWTVPKLSIDRDGEWFDDGVQVTHHGIVANLRSNLRRDAEGYFIQTRVRIPVTVEDVPWVITRLERRGHTLHGFLNDGTDETIDPASLRIGAADVPYCTVKSGQFEARLSRAATFQLLALTEAGGGGDVLRLGGKTWPLRRSA